LQSRQSDLRNPNDRRPIRPPWLVTIYGLFVGLFGLALLGYRLAAGEGYLALLPVLLFATLSFLVQRTSFNLGSPVVHSLAGVIDLAAVLALGPTSGALVTVLSGATCLELSAVARGSLTRRHMVEIPLFNAGLKAIMALVVGSLYVRLNGPLPLSSLDALTALAVGVVCLVWFVLDHLGWGIWDFLAGGLDRLRLFLREAFPRVLLVELLPLPFSVILALVYTQLSWVAFALVALLVVAVALLTQRWADARTQLLQRVTELTTIERVGRTIAQAQLDVDDICDLMYEWASQIADATIFHLGLFDGDEYTLKLWVRDGERAPPQTFRLTSGVGLVNWLRESKEPLLVRDFAREIDSLPARPAYVSDEPPRSALYVPLMAGEVVIGTMSVQSFRRNAYGDSDLRVLSAMGNQAALAIQKARLYTEAGRRVQQLETIGQVSRQVTATLELSELFDRVVHLVRESFGYYHVAIYTADKTRTSVTYQASASASGQEVAFDVEWEQGLVGWVAAHRQAVMVNDVENDTRYRCVEALEETRSELAVPLVLDNDPVGVLDVQNDQVDAFGPDDLFILETLGAQIAIAIQEARLYESERQQAWLSTALVQVADSMSRVSDMDSVLTSIVRLTPILAGVDRCTILLWDANTELFRPAQSHGLSPELRETFDRLEFPEGAMPVLDLIRLRKAPLLVDAARDAGLVPRAMAETFDIREMALLPLLAQGELLGIMMVDYAGKPYHFSERIIGMLAGIANQAAMVIQSARLVQAQQEEAYVSMALLQVAEAVSRSTDLEETLATVVRITPILVGVEACALFLWDRDNAALMPFQQYGLKGNERAAFWALRLNEPDALVRELTKGQPFVDLQGLDGSPEIVSALGRDSLLALPLTAKGEILGTMIVEQGGAGQRFMQRWMSILSGIAGQAAMAIENDLLLQEAAEQERMKQELAVAQRIQASFLPECCPHVPGWDLASIWHSARQVSGDFYDFIPLPVGREDQRLDGGRMGLVIADVADKGVPAALFMALSRTLVRTMAIDGRAPALAIARANDLILADARSGLFVTLFYTIIRPEAGEITYVNAGHMPPLVVRAADGSVEELRVPGMALGILPSIEFQEWNEWKAWLEPGDTLILYTDGVTDASDSEDQRFGLDRLKEVASTHRSLSAAKLADAIHEAVEAFVGGAAQFDDFTLVVAKRDT
jgi:sigma-B regulation protein RsbU (phosphoserine phosphatase)